MSHPGQKHNSGPRRRYLVHLLCLFDSNGEICRYVVRIQLWTGRHLRSTGIRERAFADDNELIATINPLLPPGSDVRDVFGHIETEKGFYYLLPLSSEEAAQLGWIE
jgi:hypothetical protein